MLTCKLQHHKLMVWYVPWHTEHDQVTSPVPAKIMEGNSEQVKDFSSFLGTLPEWGPYKIDPWITGNYLFHLKGRHTKVFLGELELVIQKLNEIFIWSDICDFNDALRTFYSMSFIIILTQIDLFDPVNEILNLVTVSLTNESSGSEIETAVMEKHMFLAKNL